MKIAIITPHYYPAVCGTAVTVRRIEKYLGGRGCRVKVCSLDAECAEDASASLREFAPDLIHAFHGYLGGRAASLMAREMGIPYLVTLTGSDVYEALVDVRKEKIHGVLREASALVVFDKSVKKLIMDRFPTLAEKTSIIPQGVELPGEECPDMEGITFMEGTFVFLLTAGLRPLKDVLFALSPLAGLHEKGHRFSFIMAGPVLDPDYAAEVMTQLERHPFAHYFGRIGRDNIGCLYRRADVVLNTSSFEGGMADAVLEAMAFGKPVLAADIEGNRSAIKDGVNGLLYRDADDFREKALRLMIDGNLRERLGENGRRMVLEEFRPEAEAAAYIRLYEAIV